VSRSLKVAWKFTHDDDGDRGVDGRAHEGEEHRSRVSVQGGAIRLGQEEEHLSAKLEDTSRMILSWVSDDANIKPSVAIITLFSAVAPLC
jgi:hypothetical protein